MDIYKQINKLEYNKIILMSIIYKNKIFSIKS